MASGNFLGKPEERETLFKFYQKVHPGGPGWQKIIDEAKAQGLNINEKEEGQAWEMPRQILLVFIGCVAIYSSLFSIGGFVYGQVGRGVILGAVAAVAIFFLFRLLKSLRVDQ